MDIEKLLPLILIALYYLFGKKSSDEKKKAPKPVAQKRPTASSKPQKTLEDIIRELSGQPEEKESKPAERKKIKHTHEADIPMESLETKKYVRPRIESKSTRRVMAEEAEEIDFDLQQAVINDAILNRPQHW
ncbi:MAG: hypothetical protein H6607_08315 [Flavobacteriales bacterium]|nr:hypothetical protein [Flavobacteriales bacterium]